MALAELAYRFAVSPMGRSLDRHGVRWLGVSPLGMLVARYRGVPYNPHLLLTTRGRKTGLPRPVVLPCFPAGPDVAVVGSRGGAPADPGWVHNLRAEPRCEVRLRGASRPMRARIADGEERAELWRSITERAPVYLSYQERAQGVREIPLIVLEPPPTPEPSARA